MTQKSNEERLVRLETLVEQVLSETKDIKTDIKTMTTNYVTKEDYIKEIADLKNELSDAKKVGKTRTSLVAVITSVVTALITYEAITLIGG